MAAHRAVIRVREAVATSRVIWSIITTSSTSQASQMQIISIFILCPPRNSFCKITLTLNIEGKLLEKDNSKIFRAQQHSRPILETTNSRVDRVRWSRWTWLSGAILSIRDKSLIAIRIMAVSPPPLVSLFSPVTQYKYSQRFRRKRDKLTLIQELSVKMLSQLLKEPWTWTKLIRAILVGWAAAMEKEEPQESLPHQEFQWVAWDSSSNSTTTSTSRWCTLQPKHLVMPSTEVKTARLLWTLKTL